MILLLLAWQLSSTNCMPTANGGQTCTTMTTPDMSQTSPRRSSGCALCNLISDLDKKRHERAVGKMLANGDCAGAEQYALQKGDLDLADRVKGYCEARPVPAQHR